MIGLCRWPGVVVSRDFAQEWRMKNCNHGSYTTYVSSRQKSMNMVRNILPASREDQNKGRQAKLRNLYSGNSRNEKKRRRNRKPNFKHLEKPLDRDVLLGRKGWSNDHIGHVAYRDQVRKLREWYRRSDKNIEADCRLDTPRITEPISQTWCCDGTTAFDQKHHGPSHGLSGLLKEHIMQEEQDAKKRSKWRTFDCAYSYLL